MASWIWLPREDYPELQYCYESQEAKERCPDTRFAAVRFVKRFDFSKKAVKASVRISADTVYMLNINGSFVGAGPAQPGGDWIFRPGHPYYADIYPELAIDSEQVNVDVTVGLSPTVCDDISKGHGGLKAELCFTFEDGTSQTVGTDPTWLCRVEKSIISPTETDENEPSANFIPSQVTPDIWQERDSMIPPLSYERVEPIDRKIVSAAPGENAEAELEFDKIYAAYVLAEIDGKAEVSLEVSELPVNGSELLSVKTGDNGLSYRSFRYHSVGRIHVTVKNTGEKTVSVKAAILTVRYPGEVKGSFDCSDRELVKLYEVCCHTLGICRQGIHLDSPKHQEMLACTGDYYIESLMTAMTYGDMRLAEFDLIRTADWIVLNEGVMFHTTYSLIWVMMLRDVFEFTGNKALLTRCEPALHKLLSRFVSYIGDNGLVEKAPDYMFVDWLEMDGYSMHHPPKYLGQTVLNAFYHGGLLAAAKVFDYLGEADYSAGCFEDAQRLKEAFNSLFFDGEKGLYFDGLPTPDEVPVGKWLPANEARKHFSAHSNTLACAFGLCTGDKAKEIMERVINNELGEVQPYFKHWQLEALSVCGLFEKYGIRELSKWKPMIAECSKGLAEGWIAPPDYAFDHSHAWGGTPAWQLPAKLTGLKVLEPGMKKLELSPSLCGLGSFDITIPTPYGDLKCRMRAGEKPVVSAPEEVEVFYS